MRRSGVYGPTRLARTAIVALAIVAVGGFLPGAAFGGLVPSAEAPSLTPTQLAPSLPSPLPAPPHLASPAPFDPRPAAFPPIGVTITTLGVGNGPIGVVTDPVNGYAYVANSLNNSVTVVNGTTVLSTIGVGSGPEGGVYDPSTGWVDIVCRGSNEVTAINGTFLAGEVGVGTAPYAAAYDAADKEVYVANYGSNNVTVLNKLTSVAAVALPPGSEPVGVGYDAADSEIYVSEYGNNSASIISGTKVMATIAVGRGPGGVTFDAALGEIYIADGLSGGVSVLTGSKLTSTIALGYSVWGAAYDGANQLVYVTDNGTGTNVTAIGGGSVVGQIPVGQDPLGAGYDSLNGVVYVTSETAQAVTVISTALLLGGVAASPLGNPANSTELGASVSLTLSLEANTSWRFAPTVDVPTSGMGCGTAVFSLTGPPDTLASGTLSVNCVPTAENVYDIAMVINATGRITISGTIAFTVYPRLTVPIPVASHGSRTGITQTDLQVVVGWNVTASNGSGHYTNYAWSGFPLGACSAVSTASPICRFTKIGAFTVTVSVTDSEGVVIASPTRTFSVGGLPDVLTPTASRSTADVNQVITFTTQATGGSGGYSYFWLGVPANCRTTSVPTLDCAANTSGIFSVSVYTVDSNDGRSTTSLAASVVIFGDPVVPPPVATPAKVSTGENFVLTENVTGGPGNETISWEGLPPGGCSYSVPVADTATCRTVYPGTYLIFVSVIDGNDFEVNSSKTAVEVSGNAPQNSTTTNGSSTFLGLPALEGYAIVGLGLVILVAVIAVAASRSRSGSGGDDEPREEPPTETESEPIEEETPAEEEPPPEEPLAEEPSEIYGEPQDEVEPAAEPDSDNIYR